MPLPRFHVLVVTITTVFSAAQSPPHLLPTSKSNKTASNQEQSASSNSENTQILELMADRDDSIFSMVIPYEMRVLTSTGQVVTTWEECLQISGDAQRMTSKCKKMVDGALRPFFYLESTWNGARAETFIENYPESRKSLTMSRGVDGAAFHTCTPLNFGLRTPIGTLARMLRWPGMELVGLERTSEGRALVHFRYWGGDPEKSKGMWEIWLDTQKSLLAYTVVQWNEEKDAHWLKPPSELSLRLAIEHRGKRYLPVRQWNIIDDVAIGPYWFPKRARFNYPANPERGYVELEIHTSQLVVNGDLNTATFNIVVPMGTAVIDKLKDETYVLPAAPGSRSDAEHRLEALLTRVGDEEHLSISVAPSEPQPVVEAPCGPLALYMLLRLSGQQVTLDEVMARLPEEKAVSLDDLRVASERLGRALIAVKVRDPADGLQRLNGDFIAHVKAPSDSVDVGHYVIVRVVGDKVRVINPPDRRDMISMAAFFERWTGYGLISPSQIRSAGNMTPKLLLCLAIVGGCAFFGVLWWHTRRLSVKRSDSP